MEVDAEVGTAAEPADPRGQASAAANDSLMMEMARSTSSAVVTSGGMMRTHLAPRARGQQDQVAGERLGDDPLGGRRVRRPRVGGRGIDELERDHGAQPAHVAQPRMARLELADALEQLLAARGRVRHQPFVAR